MRPWLFLLPVGLTGCFFISPADQDKREALIDADGDGVTAADDCDDGDATIGLGAWLPDGDGDGFGDADGVLVTGCTAPADHVADATDCDDSDADVNPDGTERCDAADQDEDCDAKADDEDDVAAGKTPWYPDGDKDGFGAGTPLDASCSGPANTVADGTDCDDTRDVVNPDAPELCDLLDNDCDNGVDDLDPQGAEDALVQWVDADDDGFGDDAIPAVTSCDAIADGVLVGGDCDDDYAAINPDAIEVCDASDADEDCNGDADDADLEVQGQVDSWVDADNDGYGAANSQTVTSCEVQLGYVTDATDCDDNATAINPNSEELCDPDNLDEDCDGKADNADPGAPNEKSWYVDGDDDTFGAGTPSKACDRPTATSVELAGDCDDLRADISPTGTEACDAANVDEDCDGEADDLDTAATGKVQRWPDADNDGYGDLTSPGATYCDPPATVVIDNTDCHDNASTAHPGGTEVCKTGLDEDCDGGPNQCVAPAQIDVSGAPSFVGPNIIAHNDDAVGGFDFNGDGHDDLAIGTFQDVMNTLGAGSAHLFLGPNPTAAIGAVDTVITSKKAVVTLPDDYDFMGTALAPGGDFNGDGRDELIVAGSIGNNERGLVWVIAGRNAPGTVIDTETDSRLELTSTGPFGMQLGTRIVGGGHDLTGDGTPDFVVGSGPTNSQLWVVSGTVTGRHAVEQPGLEVAHYSAVVPADRIGFGPSVGDLDGDGVGDLVIGGGEASNSRGRVWVVLGPITTPSSAALDATGSNVDFVLTRATTHNDRFGRNTHVADVDGDGLDDLITASGWDRPDIDNTYTPGVLHVFKSPLSALDTTTNADVRVVGFSNPNLENFDTFGYQLDHGEFDGDGQADLLAGIPYLERPTAAPGPFDGVGHGAVVVMAGEALLTNGSTIRLDDHVTAPISGITLIRRGVPSEYFGSSARSAGDADGDGYDDLLVTESVYPFGSASHQGATWLIHSTGL